MRQVNNLTERGVANAVNTLAAHVDHYIEVEALRSKPHNNSRPTDYIRVALVFFLTWLVALFVVFILVFEASGGLVPLPIFGYLLLLTVILRYSAQFRTRVINGAQVSSLRLVVWAVSSGIVGVLYGTGCSSVLLATIGPQPTQYFVLFAMVGGMVSLLFRWQVYKYQEFYLDMLVVPITSIWLIFTVIPVTAMFTPGLWQAIASQPFFVLLLVLLVLLLPGLIVMGVLIVREPISIANNAANPDIILRSVEQVREFHWRDVPAEVQLLLSEVFQSEHHIHQIHLVTRRCRIWLANLAAFGFIATSVFFLAYYAITFALFHSNLVLSVWLADLVQQNVLVQPQVLLSMGLDIDAMAYLRFKVALFYAVVSAMLLMINVAATDVRKQEMTRNLRHKAEHWMAALSLKHACIRVEESVRTGRHVVSQRSETKVPIAILRPLARWVLARWDSLRAG